MYFTHNIQDGWTISIYMVFGYISNQSTIKTPEVEFEKKLTINYVTCMYV